MDIKTLDDYLDARIPANDEPPALTRHKLFAVGLFGALSGLLIGVAPVAQSQQAERLAMEAMAYEHQLVIDSVPLNPMLYSLDLYQPTPPLFFTEVKPPFID